MSLEARCSEFFFVYDAGANLGKKSINFVLATSKSPIGVGVKFSSIDCRKGVQMSPDAGNCNHRLRPLRFPHKILEKIGGQEG